MNTPPAYGRRLALTAGWQGQFRGPNPAACRPHRQPHARPAQPSQADA